MVIAYILFQYIIAPALGIPVSHTQNIIITSILTTASVIRGYLWRRFFNKQIHKKVHAFVIEMMQPVEEDDDLEEDD